MAERTYLEADGIGEPVLIVSELDLDYQVKMQRNESGRLGRVFAKAIGKQSTVHALKNINLVVRKGEVVALLGTSGSGKSSLIRVLAGLEHPTRGAVWASTMPELLSTGGTQMKLLSGARNVRLSLLARGLSPEAVADAYSQAVKVGELKDYIHRPLDSYSSGMRSRLRFATAMARVPELLLIDEGLGGGDATFAQKRGVLLDEMRAQAAAVILVGQSPGSAAKVCTRAVWLDKGVVRADGPAATVIPMYEKFLGSKASIAPGEAEEVDDEDEETYE